MTTPCRPTTPCPTCRVPFCTNGFWTGMRRRRGVCLGASQEPGRGGSSSRSSCFSRRRSSVSSPYGERGCRGGPRLQPWPTRRAVRRSTPGEGWAIRGVHCGCTPQPWQWSNDTSAKCLAPMTSCLRSQGLAPTPHRQCPPSPSGHAQRCSTRTCAGYSPGSSTVLRRLDLHLPGPRRTLPRHSFPKRRTSRAGASP